MAKTYLIGHQKPDTDSVVAVLALEYLYQQKPSFGYENPQAVITGAVNNETQYLLDKFQVQAPKVLTADQLQAEDKVVLVDHNEESQRLVGLKPEQICEIVDHHKASFNFAEPIYLNFKPWGSTTSIVYFLMQRFAQEPVQPTKALAGLMLGAILSDTVGFKSSTTTPRDKAMAVELAQIAQINDLDEFALEIFKAKSNLNALSPEQLVKNDYKVFQFKKKVFIGQLETVEQEQLIKTKKADLLTALQIIKEQEQVEFIYLAISDILKVNTKLIILGEPEAQLATRAFSGTVVDHILDIGPKLSRKKDIAPAIEKALANS